MDVSRRRFLVQSGAVAALTAVSRADVANPLTRFSSKKGLGGSAPAASGLETSWYYNWKMHPATTGMPAQDPAIQFHPMCWGWKPAHGQGARKPDPAKQTDDSTPEGLLRLRAQQPSVLFGFNEPDKSEQSNLTVQEAIDAWPSLQGVAKELVSPSCAQPNGVWMTEFMLELERRHLHIDTLGYHTYPSDSVEAFIRNLEAFYKKYQRPVWVTEFAVADWKAKDGHTINRYSVEQVADFMRGACKFLEETPWIRGYAWFPSGGRFATADMKGPLASSVLFHPDGTLTDLGKVYASL